MTRSFKPFLLIALVAAPATAQQTIPDVGNYTLPPSQRTAPPPPAVVGPSDGPTRTPHIDPSALDGPIVPPPVTVTLPRVATSRETPRVVVTPEATTRAPETKPVPAARPAAPSAERPVVAEPTRAPAPAPETAPSVAPPVTVAPVPRPTPPATVAAPTAERKGLPTWLWPLIGVLLAAGAVAFVLLRRRGRPWPDWASEPAPEPAGAETIVEPVAAPVAPMPAKSVPAMLEPAPAAPAPRAWIELTLVARRAGLNLLTAIADLELTLVNTGEAPARDVRVEARLVSAGRAQDDELGRLFAAPIARPATAPFDLAPGETRTVRTLVTLPREGIAPLTATGRPMFVPVAAINLLYDSGAGAGDSAGQTAAAFAIGIARAGAAKLAPFWLDQPGRMEDALEVRPHALAVQR